MVNVKCKALAVYINSDHAHILVGYEPDSSISNIVRDIKSNSSRFINEKRWIIGKFNWQDGYGAFSCSKSQLDNVGRYILNQPKHHKKSSFREEYIELLEKMNIKYDEKYLFDWIV